MRGGFFALVLCAASVLGIELRFNIGDEVLDQYGAPWRVRSIKQEDSGKPYELLSSNGEAYWASESVLSPAHNSNANRQHPADFAADVVSMSIASIRPTSQPTSSTLGVPAPFGTSDTRVVAAISLAAGVIALFLVTRRGKLPLLGKRDVPADPIVSLTFSPGPVIRQVSHTTSSCTARYPVRLDPFAGLCPAALGQPARSCT